MRRAILLAAWAAAVLAAGCAAPVAAQPTAADLHPHLAGLDDVRALAMRALMKAQDLKCVHLYGRGFGLDMPEAAAEDLLIEGLWLFDHLYALDATSMSLLSYAAADAHPNLGAELEAFRAFLPEAADKTLAYWRKVSATYDAALAAVRAAAEKAAPTAKTSTRVPGAAAMVSSPRRWRHIASAAASQYAPDLSFAP